jgi:hypothetical protein
MKPEQLAHWYIRLNGFFTITNFVVHPSRPGSQLTEADIVGVRFPHRAEFPEPPGADEQTFARITGRPYFLLAEVKHGYGTLNLSWIQRGLEIVAALLQDLGPFPAGDVAAVTRSLLSDGVWDSDALYASLFIIADRFDPDLPACAPRRTWDQVSAFIYARFTEYRRIKADNEQWDPVGKELWRHCTAAHSKEDFVARVKAACSLKTTAYT